jgi:integrase
MNLGYDDGNSMMMVKAKFDVDASKINFKTKDKKIKKNYSSDIFTEAERYEIYHRIEGYLTVKRFLEKRSRGSQRTAIVYHTALTYLEKYLQHQYQFSIDTALEKLRKGKLDVYNLIEDCIRFLLVDLGKTPNTAKEVLKAVRSFLRSERVSLDPRLVTECASIPKPHKDTESDFALDKPTAAKILGSPMNRRLRVFLYTLASSGARVGELSSICWKDVDLDANPVSIHLRAEITKTKVGRTVYVTRETAEEIKQWLLYRQTCRNRNKRNHRSNKGATTSISTSKSIVDPNEFVFQVYRREGDPKYIEHKMQTSFTNHLKSLGLYVAREVNSNNINGNGNNNKAKNKNKKYERASITLHSFRKLFKVQVSLSAKESDLSEYLLGHRSTLNQTYFKVSPADVSKVYLDKIMEHLTFCDIASAERAKEELNQKLIEERAAKDRELGELKKRLSAYEGKLDSVVNRIGDILGQADPLKQKEYLEAVKSIQNR